MRSRAAALSPLTQIIGFHFETLVPDAMHGGPLGTVMILNGTALLDLCQANVFGDGGGPGPWKEILVAQLTQAFESFKAWSVSHGKSHSTPRFTGAKLSLKSLRSWPLLKCKAHNELVALE